VIPFVTVRISGKVEEARFARQVTAASEQFCVS